MTDTAAPNQRSAFRTCPLCEAGCGLEIELVDEVVRRIRGDQLDVFSHGFICPKGSTLRQLHADPDRITRPLVKRDGEFVEVTWDEAFAAIESGLMPLLEAHGRDAAAVYVGNPNAHNLAGLLYNRALIKGLGSSNLFSASTVDQRPKEISAGLMFGNVLTLPVPDIDRTDHLIVLGANPVASNGSLATAPDWPGRIDALLARGGTLVVVDPRRSETAELATEHLAIRPAGDAFFLASLLHVLVAEGRVDLGTAEPYVRGVDELARVVDGFSPEATSAVTGLDPDVVTRIARELADAPTACVYGRIGTTTTEYGTVASWLVDVVNLVTGNLDRPGGAMFTKAAVGAANTRGPGRYGRGLKLHRRTTRVRGLPETLGEYPVVALAEEIDTPGDDRVRAFVCVAGNPVLSTPNSERLDAALASLDFMVAVDIYVNETTRHADVILPSPSALQKGHYDIALLQLALRNVANYSPPVLPLEDGQLDEWEVFARLALLFQGFGPDGDPGIVDDAMVAAMVERGVADEHSPVYGREAEVILDELSVRRGPERILDFMVRTGPYGDGFGARPDGLTLDVLLSHPHGIDLGPLEPRLPEALRSPDGMIDLAPEVLMTDLGRLRDRLADAVAQPFVLVGRRHVRSNNSWMHNVEVLVKGRPRCTLQIHPDDAAELGIDTGDPVQVESRVGSLTAPAEVTDAIVPGVVSLPHGWGHAAPGARLSVAAEYAGVNSNLLSDDQQFDPISGTAALNGIPVALSAG